MADRFFALKIRLGGAAMLNGEDVAEALRNIANYVEQRDVGSVIIDANGNTVGHFRYVEGDPEAT